MTTALAGNSSSDDRQDTFGPVGTSKERDCPH